ncbi:MULTISPECIES: UxaA family hydrolase [unclassified Lacrimispora]|uniref:UxaA family hydrolase n=1 Tax=unclassified Lacrimispora TaxID=2719232 RepID=UPI00305B2314|nr:altronate dehydratase family protein [Lachnospiraceae bacterium]
MRDNFIQINPQDNVAVALCDNEKGTEVIIGGDAFILKDDILFGHKIALKDFSWDEEVIKYGESIGHITKPAQKGEWIHSHNLSTNLEGLLDYRYIPLEERSEKPKACRNSFHGYRRADGSVGIRNEIWIIPTVSCVNTTVNKIAKAAGEKLQGICDGVYAFPHNAGCSQLGHDFDTTQKILSSIVHHPNAGGVLLVSLGCENNDLQHFLPVLGDYDHLRIRTMVTQDVEGDEVLEGVRLVEEIARVAADDKRSEVSASELKIGFKCGGSDAFSGVTANPLCGRIADRVVELGGSGILTEVPEMFGAESLLMNRADSDETFQKVVDLINSFKQYYIDYNQPIYENPSPGNKRGGITTLEEKSLGCIQKGGKARVTDTLQYGQFCKKPGINLMIGPGNDSVSITNLLASGAQILLFTTGRGNPLATAIPTIKVASNDRLYSRKQNWIDFNAGMILEGKTLGEAADELWELVLDICSGKKQTKNEISNYREIMIFKNGVLL